jgi:GntR family transcriptional regulator / MocR family aminotransferase
MRRVPRRVTQRRSAAHAPRRGVTAGVVGRGRVLRYPGTGSTEFRVTMNSPEPVFEFPLSLAARGPGSRVRQLHGQLRAAILDRRLLPGARLPSTRRVASAYGIARNTVVAAYDLLVAEGYMLTRAGAKAQVSELAARPRPLRRGSRSPAEQLNAFWQRATPAAIEFANAARSTAGFRLGRPELRLFPVDVWRRLLARSLRRGGRASFDYPDAHGLSLLRAAIAQHVSFTRAVACTAEDVLVTNGAQQAFDVLARALVTPGRTRVAVENPGYPPMRAALAAAGAQIVPVAVDEQGLRVDRLPADVNVVCVTPSHQFPTGVAMSMARRAALLAFAREHRAAVIEDDYDGEFRFGLRPLDALQTLDRDASVLYVGTFSKSLFPALRLGYIVTPAWAREVLTAVRLYTDTGGNAQLQDALAHFITDGHLARYVRKMRRVYAERRQVLLAGLAEDLGRWLQPLPAEAGIHLATRIRQRGATARIIAHAREHTPGAQPLSRFALGAEGEPGLVFGFGCIEAAAIRTALCNLARALTGEERAAG